MYLGICSITHDCTSIEKKRVVFQHDFVGKNIIDLNNIYIDEIDRSLLTTELSFIGYKGFGNFLRIFQILIFFHFLSKKWLLKVNTSLKENIQFKTKQIMPMNQAYDRLYSDKVSKFAIFGPISNFARSLQATPLKVTVTSHSSRVLISYFHLSRKLKTLNHVPRNNPFIPLM